jgi:hypothetical protein
MKHEFRVKMEWPIFYAYATVPNTNASPEDTARLARQLLDDEVRAAFPNFPTFEYEIDGTDDQNITIRIDGDEQAMLFKLAHGGT